QDTPMITIGGGEILYSTPGKHRLTDKTVVKKLRILKEGTAEDRITATVDEAGLQTIELLPLAARMGQMPARVRESVTALAKAGRVRVLNENPYVVVSANAFKDA